MGKIRLSRPGIDFVGRTDFKVSKHLVDSNIN